MFVIPYLVKSVAQLIFMAMDFLVIMILVKTIYDRWHFAWLEPFANLAKPAVKSITTPLGTWLEKKTGKSYSERARLILLICCLWLLQLVICGLF